MFVCAGATRAGVRAYFADREKETEIHCLTARSLAVRPYGVRDSISEDFAEQFEGVAEVVRHPPRRSTTT